MGSLVASVELHSLRNYKLIQAYVGIGANPAISKLLKWSISSKEEAWGDDIATKTALDLSFLSNNDTSTMPPTHKTRLTLKKVHNSIISKLAWLDGGGTIDYKRQPLSF